MNDIFEFVEMASPNKLLYKELVLLLEKYDESVIKAAWSDIVYDCRPANGMVSGQLPKIGRIKYILDTKNFDRSSREHLKYKELDEDEVPENIKKNLSLSVKYRKQVTEGEITEDEFDKLIEKLWD